MNVRSALFTLLGGLVVALAPMGCAPVAAPEIEPETTAASAPTPVPVPPVQASESVATTTVDPIKTRIELAIDHVRQRDLLTTNAFWTIFHGMLAFGPGLTLLDERTGARVNAIDYILGGKFDKGEIRGFSFFPTQYGLDVQMGPTFLGQGHQDQFFGYLAQGGLKAEQPVVVYGKPYTVMDFVRHTKARARTNQELSWTIIVLSEYVGTTDRWKNSAGEMISFEDLLRAEINAPVNSAACGGTHRLEGITWALHTHLRRGGKREGVWKDADEHLKKYQEMARRHQHPDGSFSTNFFNGPGDDPDPTRRIGTTGHLVEFLSMSLPEEELKSEWMKKAAGTLALLFLENQGLALEAGALYHGIHGLVLYYRRVYGWDHFDKVATIKNSAVTSATSTK